MSIARTLDGKLSATLALISIVGWVVLGVMEAYPAARPDIQTTAIVIGLVIVAYKFYSMDKSTSKDPEMQKAQIEASVELFLEKLAKYQISSDGARDEAGVSTLINLLKNIGKSYEGELPKIVTDDREEKEAKGEPW